MIKIFLSIWLIVSILIGFFTKGNAGSPGSIMILFLFGFPTLVGTYRGFVGIFREQLSACSFEELFRVASMTLLLFLLSLGEVGFFLIFLKELQVQVNCVGGGCAQGGIGLTMYIPIAWTSYALVCLANAGFIKFNFWPRLIKPDFSIQNNKIQKSTSPEQ
jgi:hypothetical protein